MSLRAHESYGQHGLTPVDRLGVWLSQRAIRRHLPSRNDLEVLELGCGYRATQLIALEPKVKARHRSGFSDRLGRCWFALDFKPSQIRLRYHKFGLNLFAAARKSDVDHA